MKTNKSYGKRIKLTKNGKVLTRKPGTKNHLNSKVGGAKQLANKRMQGFIIKHKVLKQFLQVSQ